MNLDGKDKQRIYYALSNRANYLETGDVITSAVDVENIGVGKVKATTLEQTQEVVALRELAQRFLGAY